MLLNIYVPPIFFFEISYHEYIRISTSVRILDVFSCISPLIYCINKVGRLTKNLSLTYTKQTDINIFGRTFPLLSLT